MANSKLPDPTGFDFSFQGVLPPRTPGPLGINDAADPSVLAYLGHTPGVLGCNDAYEPWCPSMNGNSMREHVISPTSFASEIYSKSSAKQLSISEKGLTLLQQVERLSLKPYDDQTGKQIATWVQGATIGFGHLIKREEWDTYKNGITEAQATILFAEDLEPFIAAVQDGVRVPLYQNEFDALTILAFNIGRASFAGSSVLKLVNDPSVKTKYQNIEEAWKAWNKSQGKVMKGLENRRNCEWKIYSQGVYERW